jgi:hypothetical protein
MCVQRYSSNFLLVRHRMPHSSRPAHTENVGEESNVCRKRRNPYVSSTSRDAVSMDGWMDGWLAIVQRRSIKCNVIQRYNRTITITTVLDFIHLSVFYLKSYVLKTEFCLRLQVDLLGWAQQIELSVSGRFHLKIENLFSEKSCFK